MHVHNKRCVLHCSTIALLRIWPRIPYYYLSPCDRFHRLQLRANDIVSALFIIFTFNNVTKLRAVATDIVAGSGLSVTSKWNKEKVWVRCGSLFSVYVTDTHRYGHGQSSGAKEHIKWHNNLYSLETMKSTVNVSNHLWIYARPKVDLFCDGQGTCCLQTVWTMEWRWTIMCIHSGHSEMGQWDMDNSCSPICCSEPISLLLLWCCLSLM